MRRVHFYLHHVGQKHGVVVVAAWKFTCGKRCDEFSALSVSTSVISALFCVVFIAGERSAVSLPCGSELKFSNDKWIKITVRHLSWFAVALEGRSGLPKNHTLRAGN